MADDDKCKLLTKKKKGTYYYKCEPKGCDKKCLVVVLWEHIEQLGLDGKKLVIGTRVKEVRCECMKVDSWDGSSDEDNGSCKLELARIGQEKVGDRKFEKSVAHCSKKSCTRECVFFIKYKNKDKELGEIESIGCECVDWDKL